MSRNLQTLRDRKNNWSLADDHKLRNVLEEIRSWLTTKINDVSIEIQENSLKIGSACVQVSNLNNQLSLFAADQFIESRVGDDTSAYADPILTSQAVIQNKQMGTTVNLRQAVLMGLELMETHFKRIDIRSEDLDEDDDPICMPESIFEPYDENLSRPLPFLIGSSDWNSSSCAGSSEEFTEIAKITEEVVISLPPFTEPKIAECRGPAYSDASDGKLSRTVSNQATSNIKDVEAESGSYSNEYIIKTCASQDAAATSSSQISLLKEKEVGNTSDFTSDSHLMSRNGISRRYSEVSITPRSSEILVDYPDFEVPHSPPDPEVYAKLQGPEISVKKILATMEDQTRGRTTESASKVVNKLFVSSSSDEDDLFSDLRNTNVGAKQHSFTYSNDFQIISSAEAKKSNLENNADVPDPDLFGDKSKPKNSLKATDLMFVNDEETLDALRNKLDSVLSNKIMSHSISGIEKCQRKGTEERIKNDGTSAVLPSIAKFRAKGPPRRSPSRLLQNLDKRIDEDEAISTHGSIVLSASAEDSRTISEKDVCERQDGQLEIDPGRFITKDVNSMKQKSNISSIFSSDSDDDIFSTLSDKSKTKTLVSKLHVGNNDILSSFSRDRSLNTSASRTQTPKTSVKLKNLFDSDDEDIFASTISVKKQEQQSAKDKQAVLKKMVQEAVVLKKDGSLVGKREVVPGKLDTSKPKRIDIFDDDSDDSLFG